MFSVVDFASEEGHPSAVLLCIVNELESVISRARASPKDAHDQVRIILSQFLHPAWPVINNLQKQRPPRLRHPGQTADDVIIDKLSDFLCRNTAADIRVENLEKVSEFFLLGFFAEFLKSE